MNIEIIDINKIIPYDQNPRRNLNVDKVARSIKEYGFQQPIVVDRGMIVIVGHTRLEASKKLGLKEVPVLIADLSPAKAKAYRIADNRLNQDSSWDFGLLNKEFTDLLDINYDLNHLGFDEQELESIIVGTDSEDIDLSNIEAIDSVAPEIIKIECPKEEKETLKSKIDELIKSYQFNATIKS